MIDMSAWTPGAVLELIKGGGWIVPALFALFFVCRWPPWRCRVCGMKKD